MSVSKRSLILWVIFCSSITLFYAQSGDVIVTVVDPLEKIFKESTQFITLQDSATPVARGEHASFQIAIRSTAKLANLTVKASEFRKGSEVFKTTTVGLVSYVHVGRYPPRPGIDKIHSLTNWYPDPILPLTSMDVPAHETQAVWLTVHIPTDATPGLYQSSVALSGQLEGRKWQKSIPLYVQIYPVTIRQTRLWVTNWYNNSPELIHKVTGELDKPYTPAYWQYIKILAQKMAEYRQNVAIISPLYLTQYRRESAGVWNFDFTHFDRTVEIFKQAGVIGRIEGGHIGGRQGGWLSQFVVTVPVEQGDSVVFTSMSINSDTARNFYRQFMPALTVHLKAKGWDKIYMQHLMDEPIPENVQSYIEIASFIKQYAPDLKIVEACHSRDVANTVQIWVPQLDYLHQDYKFYQERAEAGDEIWFYTCLNPKGEYANRFIEQPLLKTRLLHWINYRYNIPGYLHWGFNFWRDGDPYVETTSIQTESGTILPGGDAWIVYPGKNTLHSSIRLEAMRDGIVDYELLKMLEEKNSEEAKELARQVIYRFDYYDMHIGDFRAKRKKILELLSN